MKNELGETFPMDNKRDAIFFRLSSNSFACARGLTENPYKWHDDSEHVVFETILTNDDAANLIWAYSLLTTPRLRQRTLNDGRSFRFESYNVLIFNRPANNFSCGISCPAEKQNPWIEETEEKVILTTLAENDVDRFARMCADLKNCQIKKRVHDNGKISFLFS